MLNSFKYYYITLGISFLIPFFMLGQNQNVPLNQTFSFDLEKRTIQSEKVFHSAFKPILKRDIPVDSVTPTLELTKKANVSWAERKMFYEHFVTLDTGIVFLTIDPLFNFEFGKDLESDPRGDVGLYKSMRGFNVKLQLGQKVAVESSFRENQAVLPYYLSQRTRFTEVAYGQGRTKTFGDNGYDFAMADAYISYSPTNRINIQAGHGKHFVGNGHRSQLLSDVAFNYPFLKLNTNWWEGKLQYQNLFAVFQDLNRLQSSSNTEGLFERKQAVIHFLEYSPNNKFSIGLFEKVIFPTITDSGNVNTGVNYWLPLIGLNSIIEGSENQFNSNLGLNVNLKLRENIQVYGQISLTDESFSKSAYQLGTKWFAHKNLLFQAEFNQKNFRNLTNLNSHYAESLTTPITEEHNEWIGISTYKKNRWLTRGMLNYISGEFTKITFLDFRQAYIVNPSFNFTVHAGVQVRTISSNGFENVSLDPSLIQSNFKNSTYIYFGISTNLQNLYFNY